MASCSHAHVPHKLHLNSGTSCFLLPFNGRTSCSLLPTQALPFAITAVPGRVAPLAHSTSHSQHALLICCAATHDLAPIADTAEFRIRSPQRINRRPRGFCRRAGFCTGCGGLSNSPGATALLDASLAISRPRAPVLIPSAGPFPLSIRLLTKVIVAPIAALSRGQTH